jgi:hypothetical protein
LFINLERVRAKELLGFRGQVIIEIEAFEKAFTHVFGQLRFFVGSMNEVNGPLGGVENDAAIVASFQVLFKFLAQLRAQVAIDVGRQRSQ